MTTLTYLFICLLYFVCVSLDVAMFFLQIRLILLWRRIHWLAPFDKAGYALVGDITAKVPRIIKTKKPLSERGRLIIALLVFAIARIILGTILRPA